MLSTQTSGQYCGSSKCQLILTMLSQDSSNVKYSSHQPPWICTWSENEQQVTSKRLVLANIHFYFRKVKKGKKNSMPTLHNVTKFSELTTDIYDSMT